MDQMTFSLSIFLLFKFICYLETSISTQLTKGMFVQYICSCCGVESLSKLLHGTAALASILFGQVACGGIKLTLAPECQHMP